MDSRSATTFMRKAATYRIIRQPSWQGDIARSGPKFPIPTSDKVEVKKEKKDVGLLKSQSDSIWHLLESAAGGGQKGKLVSRLLQKMLLARVEALSVDRIESLAGGVSPSH